MRPGKGRTVSNSRDRRKHAPSTVINIPVPILIERTDFEWVQAKLAKNNPKITPPHMIKGDHDQQCIRK